MNQAFSILLNNLSVDWMKNPWLGVATENWVDWFLIVMCLDLLYSLLHQDPVERPGEMGLKHR